MQYPNYFKIHRTIMTAGHCICNSRGFEHGYPDLFIKCRDPPAKKSQPTHQLNQNIPLKDQNGLPLNENQIDTMWEAKEKTKSNLFNEITARVGSQDFTKGVKQPVKHAFVMFTNKYHTWEKPDIALIITEKEISRNGNYPNVPVAPLCLPKR